MRNDISTCENGPYERFLSYGSGGLSKAELLAIILRTGTKDSSAIDLGEQILALAREQGDGELNGLHHLSLDELTSIKGIGQVKAIKISCLTELAIRMAMEEAGKRLTFNSPSSVVNYYRETLRHKEKETVLLLILDNRLQLIKEHTLSIGTVKASLLSPREVFVEALKEKAVYVMLIHNHPSGDATPSQTDKNITMQIASAGKLLDVPLVDHIVIGDNCYYSFKENGLME